jgi:hypothetical protein
LPACLGTVAGQKMWGFSVHPLLSPGLLACPSFFFLIDSCCHSRSTCILPGFLLKISSYAFRANVEGDVIPLVSPRRFKIRCSSRLDTGICDMLCTYIWAYGDMT